MPREIPTPSPMASIDGVIIQRADLRQAARADRLEKETRQHVSLLLRNAEREADALRQEGFRQGYQAGMLTALTHTANCLAAWQKQADHWRNILEAHGRDLLTAAVDHPDTLLLLLDEWLREQPRHQATLRLLLPRAARVLQARLMALLSEQWDSGIQIDYHDDHRFILRCGQQVAEFAPEDFIEQANRQLRQHLLDLPDDCRHISDQALRQLISTLEQQCSGPHEPTPRR